MQEVWEGNAKCVKQLETVQMTAAEKIPRCPCTTTVEHTQLRAQLGIYPLKRKRDMRKLKCQYEIPGKEYAKKEVSSHS